MSLKIKSALFIIIGSLIFIGLPLLGWGVGNGVSFFHHSARAMFVIIMLILQFFSILYNPSMLHRKKNEDKSIKTPKTDLFLIQVFSVSIMLAAPYSDAHGVFRFSLGETARYAGLFLLPAGFILMQAAQKHLGRQFSTKVVLVKDHMLIKSGPYKMVRHPRYLGIMLFFSGISLVFDSFLAILITAALSLVLLWRVNAEEKLMENRFGNEWRKYRKTSWRLIPRVY